MATSPLISNYKINFRLTNEDIINNTITIEMEEIAKKETEGKLDYSEINLELLDLMAKRFNKNKDKYPKGNSRKPLDKTQLVWAIFRHTRKILKPIKDDPETMEDHLAAIGCNVSMIIDQLELENEQKELSKGH